MFINKHVQDVIVVILSVYYVDHLLRHDFLGSNPSGFSAKKEKEKKTGKKEEKAEQRAAYAKTHQRLSLKKEEGNNFAKLV